VGRAGSKEKGRKRELRARKMLEEAGYEVTRSSLSAGVFDLIAVSPTSVRLIQVKTNSRPRPVEREALKDFQVPACCCTKEIWVFYDGTLSPVIEVL